MACVSYSSETAKSRHITARYCTGNGVDLGSGGEPVVPHAIQFDLGRTGHLNGGIIQWVGLAAHLPFKNDVLDFVFSSHLLEDYPAQEWTPILREWTRTLKSGGYLIVQVPDRARFRTRVAEGQPDNGAHQHESAIGELPMHINMIGGFRIIYEAFEPAEDYNIVFIAQKI